MGARGHLGHYTAEPGVGVHAGRDLVGEQSEGAVVTHQHEVPITAVVATDASALKTGTRVFITATKATDGALSATRILATN